MPNASDVLIVGAGPAGLATAIAVARAGATVTLAAPLASIKARSQDTRTTALLRPSIDFLDNLGTLQPILAKAAPLDGIRLIDDTGSLLRAPEVVFRAAELGLSTFGLNIANADLVDGLASVALADPRVTFLDTDRVTAIESRSSTAVATLADGSTREVALIIAADGQNSIGRRAVGAHVQTWRYPQSAIAVTFGHTRDHDNISTEFHRPTGPFTTVPLPEAMARALPFASPFASSLVWVEAPKTAEQLMAATELDFVATLSRQLQGLLGGIGGLGRRALYPLSAAKVSPIAGARVALVGEAAHVLPPIGAQGLNLGLRDAAEVAGLIQDALDRHQDIGHPDVLHRYDRARRIDIETRTAVVDGFNRALLSEAGAFGALPHAARWLGLSALASMGPLRRMVMQAGLEPIGGRPRLMTRQIGEQKV